MSEFKVGDRVEVTDWGRNRYNDNNFGTGIGTVVYTEFMGLPYTVTWDKGEDNNYCDKCLKLLILNLENI